MSISYESLFEYKDYSNESIAQQSPKFFNELADIIRPYVKKSYNEITSSDLDRELRKCIKVNMGIDIPITLIKGIGSYFKYLPPTNNNPLNNGWETLEYFNKCKIKVDNKRARITGDISIFDCSINVDSQCIHELMSAEEIAAILLHELGHVFYTFSLIGQFTVITYALRDVSRRFNNVTINEKEIYLTSVADEANLPSIDIDSLKNSKDAKEVVIVFYNELMRKFRSELGVSTYDKTLSEYLADQFSIRHGAGKHLVTALSKIYREFGYSKFSIIATNTLFSFIKWSFIPLVTVLLNPVLAATIGFGLLLFLFTKTTKNLSSRSTDIYDQDRERLIRIRQSMQLRMREDKLTKEEERNYVQDTKLIDEIIDQTKNNDLLTSFVGRLIGDNYKRLSQQQLIATYERLAYNRLFDKAFELRQLA